MRNTGRTSAEETAAWLEEAGDRGIPVLIPGAREPHHHVSAVQFDGADAVAPVMTVSSSADRLAYEREGGGAPAGRRVASPGTFSRMQHAIGVWFRR